MSRGRVKSIFRQSFHGMSAPVEGDRRSSFLIVFLLCHFGALALGRPLASRVWRTSERVWRNWKLLLVDRIWWTFVHPVFHLLSLPSLLVSVDFFSVILLSLLLFSMAQRIEAISSKRTLVKEFSHQFSKIKSKAPTERKIFSNKITGEKFLPMIFPGKRFQFSLLKTLLFLRYDCFSWNIQWNGKPSCSHTIFDIRKQLDDVWETMWNNWKSFIP